MKWSNRAGERASPSFPILFQHQLSFISAPIPRGNGRYPLSRCESLHRRSFKRSEIRK